MKKLFSLFVLFALCSTAYAEFRSVEEALTIANSSVTNRRLASNKDNKRYRLVGVKNQVDQQTPAFYVLQRDSNLGFMLISAETKTETILGYSESGSFNLEDAPANVRFWMDRYARQISVLTQSSSIQPKKMTTSYTPISPLIGSEWGQGSPYNLQCPKVSSTSTVTGCVATAVSQIMFKHKHPAQGTGSHSYTWNSQTLSANFGTTTYDWNNMLKKYTSTATTAQKNAVATLVYHVGVSCDMGYGTGGSWAVTNTAVKALLTYFDYDPAVRVYKLDYSGEEATQAAIVNDLQEGRPVLFSGRTVNDEGHAFVCEGLDAKGYLYINWGWDGYQDGYFALTLLDPQDQGTGGSASNEAFTEDVTVFTGIRPNQSGTSVPFITATKSTLYSKERIAKSTYTGFTLTSLTNSGVADWNPVAYLLVTNKTDGSIVAQKSKTISSQILKPGYYYTSAISVTGSFSTLAAGEYNLGLYVVDASQKAYPVQVLEVGNMVVPITVTNDSIFFDQLPEEPTMPNYSHIRMINTYNTNTWSIDFYSPRFWLSSSAQNDRLIRCTIESGSGNAVVGTYDIASTSGVGSIASGAMYAYGYSNSCQQYSPSQLQFTITAEQDNSLRVDYYYVYNTSEKVVGSAVIESSEQDWWQLYQGSNYLHNSYTLNVASPMSVVRANSLGSACTDSTYIPFLIKGKVSSNVTITKDQLSFSISDDGGTTNELKINDCLWLNKAKATASCGLQKGDEVVVYTKLYKVSSQVSGSGGYVYEHTSSGPVTDVKNIHQADGATSVRKVQIDGHVHILRDGKMYNLLGAPVE